MHCDVNLQVQLGSSFLVTLGSLLYLFDGTEEPELERGLQNLQACSMRSPVLMAQRVGCQPEPLLRSSHRGNLTISL